MTKLETMIDQAGKIVILGHVNPDGDCVGSCLAVYNYIKEWDSSKTVTVRLERLPSKFSYLSGFDAIETEAGEETYDLCICLDSSDEERLGDFKSCFDRSAKTICIDHHITNRGYAQENVIDGHASSACEVVYGQLDESRISKRVAECIYTGIIHDTGVFKYSNTSRKTMEIAGRMMEKGIDFGTIIDGSFYKKTYMQSQILGRALLESITFLDGRCIFSVVRKKDMDFYGVEKSDLDGIVDQLRVIDGIECAIFLYETGIHQFKVSLRSNSIVDVSRIAAYFGGGGHVRAAGCTMSGSVHDVVNNLSAHIAEQLEREKANA
ncbi:bifunctional oligoribonuclease/PAP phosphatase NrnA [Lachnospiraceae bacterium AM48-27BH]|nr:bifunctional oligoribonuclease/PAP phosphatase NrnA [Lachnospiraceae bacterium AM48-27BH]